MHRSITYGRGRGSFCWFTAGLPDYVRSYRWHSPPPRALARGQGSGRRALLPIPNSRDRLEGVLPQPTLADTPGRSAGNWSLPTMKNPRCCQTEDRDFNLRAPSESPPPGSGYSARSRVCKLCITEAASAAEGYLDGRQESGLLSPLRAVAVTSMFDRGRVVVEAFEDGGSDDRGTENRAQVATLGVRTPIVETRSD